MEIEICEVFFIEKRALNTYVDIGAQTHLSISKTPPEALATPMASKEGSEKKMRL
jgi:hypothetical protein